MPSRKDAVYNPESAKGIKKSYQERDFLQKFILKLFGADEEEKEEVDLNKCLECPKCAGCEKFKKKVKDLATPTPTPTSGSSDKVSGALKRLIEKKRGE